MQRFVESIENSLETKNWYGALTLALTLPDICGYIDSPQERSQRRYSEWFDQWVRDKYTVQAGEEGEVCFLSGGDCYALRCSYLHQGEVDILEQRARERVESFLFVEPKDNWVVHNNMINEKLQLQVDMFCYDILEGVRKWQEEKERDFKGLLTISSLF